MNPSIVVFGETVVDLIGAQEILGGAPFNVARHLAALGEAPLFVTRVGADRHGDAVLAACHEFGIDCAGVQRDSTHATGVARVRMEPDGPHFDLADDAAFDHIEAAPAVRSLQALAGRTALLYFGTLAQRGPVSRRALDAVRAARPLYACVDPNLREAPRDRAEMAGKLHGAAELKLSEQELRQLLALAGLPCDLPVDAGLLDALARAFHLPQLQRLYWTCGERGSRCLCRGGQEALRVEAQAQPDVVDTVGAGDAYFAVVLLGRARGWPLPDTMRRAARFAAAICGVRGAVPADRRFYDAWREAFARTPEPTGQP